MHIIVFGAFVTIAGGIITAIGTYMQNKSSSEKSTRIESGVNENLAVGRITSGNVEQVKAQNVELINKVESQASIIDSLRKENTDLYSNLQEANKTLFEHVKGGQDSPHLEVVYNTNNSVEAFLFNENQYSIYGLLTEITQYDKLSDCKSIISNGIRIVDEHCFMSCSKDFRTEELGVGRYVLNNEVSGLTDITTKDYGRYQIRFRSRYKLFYQQFVYRKVGKSIFTTSRIWELPFVNYETKASAPKVVRVIKSKLDGWVVDFEKEFPTGLVTFTKRLQ